MKLSVVIPCRRAGAALGALLERLRRQSVAIDEIFVVETDPDATSRDLARSFGADHLAIRAADFDHAGTRTVAARRCRGDVVILLSQDVLPVDEDVLSHLVASFAGHPEVAACYGRQLPDRDARVFMRIKRAYLYPETSEIRSFADRERLGFRTTLMSNSFAAYRRDALESVGWFGDRRLVCEDVATTARLLLEGWQVRYVAEAVVEHAHHSAAIDELRRYFDIGAFHAHDPWIIESFGRPRREGWRYARHGVERLLREGRAALVVPFVVSCAAKRVAFTLGRHHDRLPKALRPLLSTRPTWWRAQSPTGSAVNPGSTREKSPPSGPPAR